MPRTRHTPFAALLFLLVSVTSPGAHASTCEHQQVTDRQRIGLVLGGGGARGFAHVGVLKALEELRVPYDVVAGTSMGSIVGGMVATGMDSAEISDMVRQLDWDELFSDSTRREDLPYRRKEDDVLGLYGPKLGVGKDSTLLPGGVVAGQKILFMFETLTSQRVQSARFDQLPLPFRAVATNIIDGQMVVIDRGSLAGAMRASMAVPGVFDPVRYGDRLLVDGGLVRNLPVDVARDMGAEVVVAIDVGTPLMKADEIRNVLSIIEQMSSLAVVQNTAEQVDNLLENDVLILPQLGSEITSAAFDSFEDAWPLGYQATMAQAERLSRLSLSEQDYARWRSTVNRCVPGPPHIQFVQLDNQSRFSDEVLGHYITVQPGKPLDMAELEQNIQQIYGLGFIRLAHYRIIEKDGEQGLWIGVVEDERGPDFIETGLVLTGGARGTTISLQGAYLKTDLDERGSELRLAAQVGNDLGLQADYYRYMDNQQRWIFNPSLGFSRRSLLVFNDDGLALADAEVDQGTFSLRLGREVGRQAFIYTDLLRYRGDVDITLGVPFPDQDFDGAEWRLGVIHDRLDNLFLPTRGRYLQLVYANSLEELGADQEFEQISFRGIASRTFGKHNLLVSGRYNTTLDNNAPIYGLFTGGGFLNMSGFEPAELSGQHFGLVALGYRYQVAQSRLLPGYAGFTVEYGNATEQRSDIFDEGILNGSLYFAYRTPIGPLYLGYGWSEDRSGLIFLRLGAIIGSDTVGLR
jgi:NTE family protein